MTVLESFWSLNSTNLGQLLRERGHSDLERAWVTLRAAAGSWRRRRHCGRDALGMDSSSEQSQRGDEGPEEMHCVKIGDCCKESTRQRLLVGKVVSKLKCRTRGSLNVAMGKVRKRGGNLVVVVATLISRLSVQGREAGADQSNEAWLPR